MYPAVSGLLAARHRVSRQLDHSDGRFMIKVLERLGDRVLSVFVPAITADAAGTAACTYPNCGACFNGIQRYKRCCNGVCSGCTFAEEC
jgi:hypothetical protein